MTRDGPPKLGAFILMGDGARENLHHTARNLEEGQARDIETLCRRP
ncbi:MAG: hypothetical protein VCE75_11905 [Alphaproteobacteria bacterium]